MTPPETASSVRVLYFAHAAIAAGIESEVVELKAPRPLAELREVLLGRHPALRALQPSLLWAVDEQMVDAQHLVSPGQIVAVMPPFSGG